MKQTIRILDEVLKHALILIMVALVTMMFTMDFIPAVTTIAQRMAGGVNSFALLAIPLFILPGLSMAQGGIARRVIDFSKAVVGSLPGGLAFVSLFTVCYLVPFPVRRWQRHQPSAVS